MRVPGGEKDDGDVSRATDKFDSRRLRSCQWSKKGQRKSLRSARDVCTSDNQELGACFAPPTTGRHRNEPRTESTRSQILVEGIINRLIGSLTEKGFVENHLLRSDRTAYGATALIVRSV